MGRRGEAYCGEGSYDTFLRKRPEPSERRKKRKSPPLAYNSSRGGTLPQCTTELAQNGRPMKFHLQAAAANVIAGVGADWIRIGETDYRQNLVVTPDAVAIGWAPAGFAALTEQDFASLLQHDPELVLLGTGPTQRFPAPQAVAVAGKGARRRRSHGHTRRMPHVQHPGRREPARRRGADYRLSSSPRRFCTFETIRPSAAACRARVRS